MFVKIEYCIKKNFFKTFISAYNSIINCKKIYNSYLNKESIDFSANFYKNLSIIFCLLCFIAAYIFWAINQVLIMEIVWGVITIFYVLVYFFILLGMRNIYVSIPKKKSYVVLEDNVLINCSFNKEITRPWEDVDYVIVNKESFVIFFKNKDFLIYPSSIKKEFLCCLKKINVKIKIIEINFSKVNESSVDNEN